jgi:hypothetical protein
MSLIKDGVLQSKTLPTATHLANTGSRRAGNAPLSRLPGLPILSLRHTKLVEQADGLIQSTQALYEQHEPIMRREDRVLAEDRMSV